MGGRGQCGGIGLSALLGARGCGGCGVGQWGGCNEATRTRMITRHLYLMFGCDFLSRAQSHVTSFSQSSGEACVISARGGGGKGEHGAR